MVAVAGLQRGELCRRVTGVVVTAFRQVEKAVPVRLVEVSRYRDIARVDALS